MKKRVKYIFITGGVVSSLGKGIVAASLGKLLQAGGYSVTIQKFDPYINIDPGTLNPYEHGEVYVTDDGAETDLDLGHYERFLNVPTSQANNVTAGRIYETVIKNERAGKYHGKTVQIVPHITDEIKRRIRMLGDSGKYDIVITEVGGTVGDIESLPFIEAARQMHYEMPKEDTVFIHLTLLPYISATGELKTKPTQHSVKHLLELGVQPQILVCRTEHPLTKELKSKIALFCNVSHDAVIEAMDVDTIYDVPIRLLREQLSDVVLKRLNLPAAEELHLDPWKDFLRKLKNPLEEINIGLVGKYIELPDAYKSILESLVHASASKEVKVNVSLLHSEDIQDENVERLLRSLDGVIVAPGFGKRGTSGKINAIEFCRVNNVPFLGICLGMQMACIEFARNVVGLEESGSAEFDLEVLHPVIALMEEQEGVTQMGGTMRLGSWECGLVSGSLASKVYGGELVKERHRHRYEFNNAYREQFEAAGMRFTGVNPGRNLVEIVELPAHPFFIGCQFHPEYRSTVLSPHPLFIAFIQAGLERKKSRANA